MSVVPFLWASPFGPGPSGLRFAPVIGNDSFAPSTSLTRGTWGPYLHAVKDPLRPPASTDLTLEDLKGELRPRNPLLPGPPAQAIVQRGVHSYLEEAVIGRPVLPVGDEPAWAVGMCWIVAVGIG